MNLLNRIFVLMQLIALVVLAPIFIVLLLFSRRVLRNLFEPTFAQLSTEAPGPNGAQALCIGILTVLAGFSVLMILLEVQRGGPRRLRIQSVQGAELLMSSDAITQQLEYTLDALTDVIKVKPRIQSAGKGVDAFIELWTTANVDVAQKTQEVNGVARQVLEDRLGLKVGKIQIKIDQMKMPKRPATIAPVATRALPSETKSETRANE